MPSLDRRRRDMLSTMGVTVWRRRNAGTGEAVQPEPAEPVAQPIAAPEPAESTAPAELAETTQPAPPAQPAEPVERVESEPVQRAEPAPPAQPAPPPVRARSESPESPGSLEEIAAEISQCRQCALCESRTHTVAGMGAPRADWMFVGEAPGRNEDEQGLPFVGRAGQLLDAMLLALGMQRDQVFIANVLKCRPPNNRDPLPEEVAECEPYLHRQLAVIQPRVIVALGRISAQALLKTTTPLGQLRGQAHRYGPGQVPLVVTYHPAYLLRSPAQKARAWEDLLFARSLLGGHAPGD